MGLREILKKRIVLAVIAIAGIIILLNIFVFNKPSQEYVLAEVVKGEIIQTVDVTGGIKADPTIDLHFQKGGKVKEILVKAGDYVDKDQLLASLENQTLELEIARMRANLDYANAQYEKTRAGAKYEEILIAEAEVKSADASFDAALIELDNTKKLSTSNISLATLAYQIATDNKNAAYNEYLNTVALTTKELENLELTGDTKQSLALNNAYNSAKTLMDGLFPLMQDGFYVAEGIIGIRGSGYFLLDQHTKTQLKYNYHSPAQTDYNAARELYQTLTTESSTDEIDEVLAASIKAANSLLLLLSQTGYELERLPYDRTDLEELIKQVKAQSSSLSGAILNLQDAQNTISTLRTGSLQDIETLKLTYQLQIDAAENKYKQTENALLEAGHSLEQAKLNSEISIKNAEALAALKKAGLDSAQAGLELKKSPARNVDLAPLAAQASQAQIALLMAERDYKDSQIYSPINGKVTYVSGDVGENITVSETGLKSFITVHAADLIVEANVPETDIVKINKEDKVTMTIDAFDFTEKFYGEVITIDPAETVVQGVIYYKIKTAFTSKDERIKSGMTVNLEIETEKREDVLMLPVRAIKYEDSKKYVEIPGLQKPEKVYVTTGIENDQYAEVISGLNEGDKVITFIK
ncbi:HlyD family efflux transporter periplasmic adaptor subunit [Candidatus Peregrinibacteria bacterium]|nr:HlyD family efflux transporter periplasmic adaptor subunit [Candidatus Peregrinibacteria bacterium]